MTLARRTCPRVPRNEQSRLWKRVYRKISTLWRVQTVDAATEKYEVPEPCE